MLKSANTRTNITPLHSGRSTHTYTTHPIHIANFDYIIFTLKCMYCLRVCLRVLRVLRVSRACATCVQYGHVVYHVFENITR